MIIRLILRHIALIGADKPAATLKFEAGVNVVYGASNTGKSFTLAALKFLLGSSTPLPVIEQMDGYSAALLGIEVPGIGEATLYRAITGGGIRLYQGIHFDVPDGSKARILAPEHDATREDNLSRVILVSLGLDGKRVVRNENGEKSNFTLRSLDPFMFVDEGAIIDPRSPILSGQVVNATPEKNVLKLLLTGKDDSAVVAVVPAKIRKARKEGQRELLEQWIADIDKQIDALNLTREQIAEQAERLEIGLDALLSDLTARQDGIDRVIRERRRAVDLRDRTAAQAREIELTLSRFARLMEVYESDVGRLGALEQGGHLLLARLDRPCPLCGATTEHRHDDGKQDVERARRAARAEITRIEREQQDLFSTISVLETDGFENSTRLSRLNVRIVAAERLLAYLRPREASLRSAYQERLEKREKLRDQLKLFDERDRLAVLLSQITSAPAEPKQRLSVGIDGPTGHELSMKIQEVLDAWKFPGRPVVSFDPQTQDIRLDGKERRANGKGVRAVLHSAFKIAVMLLCQDRGLPHPGVLVLDTPLLTYREPVKVPRHGALTADEQALAATTLHEHFYRHLAGLTDRAQFIILENSDPPDALRMAVTTHFFTGDPSDGRIGFFPEHVG
jgi:hypothetical protein